MRKRINRRLTAFFSGLAMFMVAVFMIGGSANAATTAATSIQTQQVVTTIAAQQTSSTVQALQITGNGTTARAGYKVRLSTWYDNRLKKLRVTLTGVGNFYVGPNGTFKVVQYPNTTRYTPYTTRFSKNPGYASIKAYPGGTKGWRGYVYRGGAWHASNFVRNDAG